MEECRQAVERYSTDYKTLIKNLVLSRKSRVDEYKDLIPAIDREFGEQFRNYLGLESVAETCARYLRVNPDLPILCTRTADERSEIALAYERMYGEPSPELDGEVVEQPIEFLYSILHVSLCTRWIDPELAECVILSERERYLPFIVKQFDETNQRPLTFHIESAFKYSSRFGEVLCAHVIASASASASASVTSASSADTQGTSTSSRTASKSQEEGRSLTDTL